MAVMATALDGTVVSISAGAAKKRRMQSQEAYKQPMAKNPQSPHL